MARKLRDFKPGRCYHLMSRIAHQEYYLTPEEKDHLVRLIRKVEKFSSVMVLAYCIMSNHIHIFVFLPERPNEVLSEAELLERIAALYGETYANGVKGEWARLEGLKQGLSADERQKFFARMYDVSEFMKSIKQRYSMSFNYENEHFGTMWEGRFKSVCVQAKCGSMAAVAAYDDLNPFRAGIVDDLANYPWCSWYAAMHGDICAQNGYRFIYGMPVEKWEFVALSHAKVMREKAGYLCAASRSFVDGGAIGDEEFILDYAREYFPKERKSGPIKLAGGSVWGNLRVAREVRAKVSMDDMGKGSDPLPDAGRRMAEMVRRAKMMGPNEKGFLDLDSVMGKGSDPIPDSMTAIEFNRISKQYRLGLVSTGTLSHDLNRFWQTKVLRREDPYLKIGETNDRAGGGR